MVVLGTIRSCLEPFCGHSSPKIDKVPEEFTSGYPPEGPCVRYPEEQSYVTSDRRPHTLDFSLLGVSLSSGSLPLGPLCLRGLSLLGASHFGASMSWVYLCSGSLCIGGHSRVGVSLSLEGLSLLGVSSMLIYEKNILRGLRGRSLLGVPPFWGSLSLGRLCVLGLFLS